MTVFSATFAKAAFGLIVDYGRWIGVIVLAWWLYDAGIRNEAQRRDLIDAKATIVAQQEKIARDEKALTDASQDAEVRATREDELEQKVRDYEEQIKQMAGSDGARDCVLTDDERRRLLDIR